MKRPLSIGPVPARGEREEAFGRRLQRLTGADGHAEQERSQRRRRALHFVRDLAGKVKDRPQVLVRKPFVKPKRGAGRRDPVGECAHRSPSRRAQSSAIARSEGVSQSSQGGGPSPGGSVTGT